MRKSWVDWADMSETLASRQRHDRHLFPAGQPYQWDDHQTAVKRKRPQLKWERGSYRNQRQPDRADDRDEEREADRDDGR